MRKRNAPNRSEKLIRRFDGSEKQWVFDVDPAFRAALDIKLTDKVVAGEKLKVRTQGYRFEFDVGDMLHYPDPDAPGECCAVIQVMDAQPSGYDTSAIVPCWYHGNVWFQAWVEYSDETIEGPPLDYICSQTSFVEVLRSGIFPPQKNQTVTPMNKLTFLVQGSAPLPSLPAMESEAKAGKPR
ncbi:MAG: hypothetical protein GY777_05885 [Candidatus Brocadiaceae bacterium]|nr:hypothetical protein [Candidatus Brocadiaceae bacterium]